MADSTPQPDPMFLQIVLSLQAGAWQHLGKVASPVSGKIERDIPMAKHTIDLLGMLQVKTDGNLTPDEKQMLDHALYELRLNFVDESNKSEPSEKETTEPAKGADEEVSDNSGAESEKPQE